jgi:predicted DNA-binding ribbon-helix-helix protein
VSLNTLISGVDAGRNGNLSSALRLFVLHTVKAEPASDLPTDEECL